MKILPKVILMLALITISGLLAQTQGTSNIEKSYAAEKTGNYTGAIELMKTLESSDANDPYFKLRLGWLYYSSAKYNEAIGYYQKSLAIKASADGYEGLVNCYLALGLWNDVIARSDDALKMYPSHYTFLLKAGYAMYMKMEYKAAIDYYQRVLTINPYNYEARGYLINSNYYYNDRVEAKKQWLVMKKYYPDSAFVIDWVKTFE
jgi:tetratricopeptide (TPR) repeat protein